MRETGRELTEARQRVFEAQLLFEGDHARQVGEEADDAALAGSAAPRRQRHAEVRRAAGHVPGRHMPARDRAPSRGGVAHERAERGHWCQQVADVHRHRAFGDAEDAVAGRIQHPDLAVCARHQQTRGQSFDDLRIEAFGRFGAGQCRTLLLAQLPDRFFERRRQDGGVGRRLAHAAGGIPRTREHLEHGKPEQAGKEADERREAEQQVTGRRERRHQ